MTIYGGILCAGAGETVAAARYRRRCAICPVRPIPDGSSCAGGQKGYVTVPRIIHADAGICMTGGHGHQDGVERRTARGACAAIREQLRAEADWVKDPDEQPRRYSEFTQEELDAAVDEAHRQGESRFIRVRSRRFGILY